MTEIGLAQRQLLDEETGHDMMESSTLAEHFQSVEQQQRQQPVVEVEYGATSNAAVDDTNRHRDEPRQNSIYGSRRPSSLYDFEPFSPTSSTKTTTKTDEIPRTGGPSLVRSRSMEMMLHSPHDTEPISSISLNSPKLSRAKSDNNGLGPSQPQQRHRQAQFSRGSSPDELARPVIAVEVPVTKKQSSTKRKQVAMEDDELALHESRTEERTRGNVTMATKDSTTTQPRVNIDVPKKSLPEPVPEVREASSKCRTNATAKEPKKKKLKRSKTSSAALKKTYESDVEDDVIWVDERPLSNLERLKNSGQILPFVKSSEAKDDHAEMERMESNPETDPHVELARKEPKKQSRRRKKTLDQNTVDQGGEHTSLEKEEKTMLQDISNRVETNKQHSQRQEGTSLDAILSDQKTGSENQVPLRNSITAELEHAVPTAQPGTPQKQQQHPREGTAREASLDTVTPVKDYERGPDKHSPIATTSRVPVRVGLSRRDRIAPLLKVVRR